MSVKTREIMNVRISAGKRTVYVDLKQNRDGARFLSISEVRGVSAGDRSRILIDEEYVADVHRALTAVLAVLDKYKRHESPTQEEYSLAPSRAYKRWTAKEDKNLEESYVGGCGVNALSEQHGRAPTAIISRLYQLGVLKAMEKPRCV